MSSHNLNKVKVEKNNEFNEKSNESLNYDNNLDEDEDNEEYEEDDEEIDKNIMKNHISKQITPQSKRIDISNGKASKKEKTPASLSRAQETFHTDKKRNNSENKNLAFLLNKNTNPNKEIINRYSSNPANNKYPHTFANTNYYPSNNYNSNGYNNNYYSNNGYNNIAFTNQNYYDSQANANRQNNNLVDTNENILFPRDQNTSNNENHSKDQNSCSYCEEYYKMALFKNIPIKLLKCPYCNNIMNQNSLQYFYKKYENEINTSLKISLNAEFNICNNINSGKNSPKFANINNTLNGTIEYQDVSTNQTKNLSIIDENKKEDYNKYNNKIMDNVEELVYEEQNNIDSKNNLSNENFEFLKENNNVVKKKK